MGVLDLMSLRENEKEWRREGGRWRGSCQMSAAEGEGHEERT
jgi:hypothetical protein